MCKGHPGNREAAVDREINKQQQKKSERSDGGQSPVIHRVNCRPKPHKRTPKASWSEGSEASASSIPSPPPLFLLCHLVTRPPLVLTLLCRYSSGRKGFQLLSREMSLWVSWRVATLCFASIWGSTSDVTSAQKRRRSRLVTPKFPPVSRKSAKLQWVTEGLLGVGRFPGPKSHLVRVHPGHGAVWGGQLGLPQHPSHTWPLVIGCQRSKNGQPVQIRCGQSASVCLRGRRGVFPGRGTDFSGLGPDRRVASVPRAE